MKTSVALAAALTLAGALAPARAEGVQLLCAAANGAYPRVVDVDYSAWTVNAWKANFTPGEITWASNETDAGTGKVTVYDNKINRLNGVYQGYGRGINYAGPGPVIVCEKAPPKKF